MNNEYSQEQQYAVSDVFLDACAWKCRAFVWCTVAMITTVAALIEAVALWWL